MRLICLRAIENRDTARIEQLSRPGVVVPALCEQGHTAGFFPTNLRESVTCSARYAPAVCTHNGQVVGCLGMPLRPIKVSEQLFSKKKDKNVLYKYGLQGDWILLALVNATPWYH